MFSLEENLIIEILEFLGNIYPRYYRKENEILPNFKDRNKLLVHLAYCIESNYVESMTRGIAGNQAPVYKDIKLHANGINYLQNKRRS